MGLLVDSDSNSDFASNGDPPDDICIIYGVVVVAVSARTYVGVEHQKDEGVLP